MSEHLKVWDLVSPINHRGTLASGCGRWTKAVVIQVDPLVLVCEDGDMCWFNHEAENYLPVGIAGKSARYQVDQRIERDEHLQITLRQRPKP